MSFAARFKDLGKAWKNTKPASGGGSLPDGKYQAVISKAQLGEIKSGKDKGDPRVGYTFKVISGDQNGRVAFTSFNLGWVDTDRGLSGIGFFKKMLETLEVECPGKMTEKSINAALGECLDAVVEIQVVTKGQFTNTYCNKLINAPNEEAAGVDDDYEDDADEDETTEEESEDETEDEDEESIDDDEFEDDDEEPEPEPEPKPVKKKAKKKTAKKKAAKKEKEPVAKNAKKAAKKKAKEADLDLDEDADFDDEWDDD